MTEAGGERLIAAYVAPESDREAIINELITLFDGPQQREAERLTSVARWCPEMKMPQTAIGKLCLGQCR
jgi:hypothetical protein